MTENYFEKLYSINVNDSVEKKNGYTYLTWSYAVAELLKKHPLATWEVKHFDNKPFMATECGYFVEVEVSINDIKRTQIHPVLDFRNKPVLKPNAFDINTAIQRCLVKAIALHGLGLYIYAGEDLPEDADATTELHNDDTFEQYRQDIWNKIKKIDTIEEFRKYVNSTGFLKQVEYIEKKYPNRHQILITEINKKEQELHNGK